MALIINRLFTCLVHYLLLFGCQTAVEFLVDTEEQAVIIGIPHGAVFLHLLDTGRINCRKRILLAFHRVLLQSRIGLGPVHIGGVSAPSLVAFHQQIGTCHTDLQIFHIICGFHFPDRVGELAETVLCHTHAVQPVFLQKGIQLLSCLTVQPGIRILHRIKDEGQGYHIKPRVKSRIDQIGMHGNLYRVAIHQSLDTL